MKTSAKLRLSMALLGALLATSAAAEPVSPETVATRLKSAYPATTFGAVSATPWPGVYEVTMGSNLAYVDASGQYFLFGHLYDMQAQRDLTAERRDALARIDFASLPLADALTDIKGTGVRTLAVFSDPDCPYCKKLEAELAALTDVTIHTFLMPIASIHPQARNKAIGVWCAQNQVLAWHALMRDGVSPAAGSCEHPVDRNIALAERLNISGTPTMIAADGRVLAGAAARSQIEDWLARTPQAQGQR